MIRLIAVVREFFTRALDELGALEAESRDEERHS